MDEYPKTLSDRDWLFSSHESQDFSRQNRRDSANSARELPEIREKKRGRPRRWATRAECDKAYRQRQKQQRILGTPPHRPTPVVVPGIPTQSTLHCGLFQSYAAAYAGTIDVIITDPPYGREYLPLYTALI